MSDRGIKRKRNGVCSGEFCVETLASDRFQLYVCVRAYFVWKHVKYAIVRFTLVHEQCRAVRSLRFDRRLPYESLDCNMSLRN